MNYLPDKETTFEKKVQTAEENLFKKIISNEEHVCYDSTSAYMVICFNYITKVSLPTYLI